MTKLLILALALCLSACSASPKKHPHITAATRSGIEGSIHASERSSVKIREFRTNAERIEYKAGRALRFFDEDGKPEKRR